MTESTEFNLLQWLNERFLHIHHLPYLNAHESLMVAYTWIAMFVIIALTVTVIVGLKRVPGVLQNMFEFFVNFIEGLIKDTMSESGLVYFPLIATVFLFVMFASYIGLVPTMLSPTSVLGTTAAIAIVVFVFYQIMGISKNGIKYFKRFLGPIPAMAPFMFIMEIISEFARPLSLSVRLFANIMGGEMIIKMLFGACAIGAPVVWMLWDSGFTIPMQSFIFSLLAIIYLGGAIVSDEH
jgi:F-type H+-transporting ATPase subunit a